MAIKEIFVHKQGCASDTCRMYHAAEFPCWAHNKRFVHDGASLGVMRRRIEVLSNRSAYYFHAHILTDDIHVYQKGSLNSLVLADVVLFISYISTVH